MTGFKPETAWSAPVERRGAPPVPVPEELQVILEKTYANQTIFELEIPAPDDPGVVDLVRVARIYCERQGKKLRHQFDQRSGKTVVKIKMRDPRPYTPRKT